MELGGEGEVWSEPIYSTCTYSLLPPSPINRKGSLWTLIPMKHEDRSYSAPTVQRSRQRGPEAPATAPPRGGPPGSHPHTHPTPPTTLSSPTPPPPPEELVAPWSHQRASRGSSQGRGGREQQHLVQTPFVAPPLAPSAPRARQ